MLKWSEPDFCDFFDVMPTRDETAASVAFEVARDGLRLLVTIFEFEAAVFVSIFRDGLPEPLFTVRRELCTHAHITDATNFRRCFEAGSPQHSVSEMGMPPVLTRGVRVYLEPQFLVEIIERLDLR